MAALQFEIMRFAPISAYPGTQFASEELQHFVTKNNTCLLANSAGGGALAWRLSPWFAEEGGRKLQVSPLKADQGSRTGAISQGECFSFADFQTVAVCVS